MIEQLWYTSTQHGLDSYSGYQVRAASPGLSDPKSERLKRLDAYLRYGLPKGTGSQIILEETPVSLVYNCHGNESILCKKNYVGSDPEGRQGNFFVHLLADLPSNWTAREAIERWDSTFWRSNENQLPSSQQELPSLRASDIPVGPLGRASLNEKFQPLLTYVIQAYLSLGGEDQLFVAGDTPLVANLIWGLTHALPRVLQQNLTFSTYEMDVSASKAKIVGTCWLSDQMDAVRASVIDLPREYYRSGAYTLNCYTRVQVRLPSDTPQSELANYVVRRFFKDFQSLDRLNNLIDAAHGAAGSDSSISDILHLYTLLDQPSQYTPTEEELAYVLSNPALAATFIQRDGVQALIVRLARPDFETSWWSEVGRSAVDALRNDVRATETSSVRDALVQLVEKALKQAAKELPGSNSNRGRFLVEEVATAASPNGRTAVYERLLALLSEEMGNRSPTTLGYVGDLRIWLLEQWNSLPAEATLRYIDPWIEVSWEELQPLLENQRLRAEWKRRAVAICIAASSPLPEDLATIVSVQSELFKSAMIDAIEQTPTNRSRILTVLRTLASQDFDRCYEFLHSLLKNSKRDGKFADDLIDAAAHKLTHAQLRGLLTDEELGLLKTNPPPDNCIKHFLRGLTIENAQQSDTSSLLRKLQQRTGEFDSKPLVLAWLKAMEFNGVQSWMKTLATAMGNRRLKNEDRDYVLKQIQPKLEESRQILDNLLSNIAKEREKEWVPSFFGRVKSEVEEPVEGRNGREAPPERSTTLPAPEIQQALAPLWPNSVISPKLNVWEPDKKRILPQWWWQRNSFWLIVIGGLIVMMIILVMLILVVTHSPLLPDLGSSMIVAATATTVPTVAIPQNTVTAVAATPTAGGASSKIPTARPPTAAPRGPSPSPTTR